MLDMRRRDFITLIGGATAWPLAARAQQPDQVRRIGVLMCYAETDSDARAWYVAFREALQKLGWTEGRNIQIETRWATPDDAESMRRLAKELVAPQPNVILSSTTPTTTALLQQTRTIPIVFAIVADPIGSGFVASFARPGGKVTGFIFTEPTMAASGWNCSRRLHHASPGSRCRSTRQRRHMPTIGSTPSKPPLPPLQWRRSPHPFATAPSCNPSLPHRHASQMVALS